MLSRPVKSSIYEFIFCLAYIYVLFLLLLIFYLITFFHFFLLIFILFLFLFLSSFFNSPIIFILGHAESYNPPPEYILTKDELAKMEDMDPKDRAYNFIPKLHDCLRRVSGEKQMLLLV